MGERIPLGVLVPLRILCGLILFLEGWGKLQHGWLHGVPLLTTLDGWVEGGKTYRFFLPVVQTARAHPKIFGALVTAGELSIGVSMLLGLLSRLGAFLGVLMLFSFAFGAGQGLVPPGNALLMGALFAVFVAAPPGRAFGLDARLRHRFPGWMT